MDPTRRLVMTTGLGATIASAGAGHAVAGHRIARDHKPPLADKEWANLKPDSNADQSRHLQHLIDAAATSGQPLYLPPGKFHVANIKLRPGTTLIGAHGRTELVHAGGLTFIRADRANNVTLDGIVFEGLRLGLDANRVGALVDFSHCHRLAIRSCNFKNSLLGGLALEACSGHITECAFTNIRRTGLFARDSLGLDISHNVVDACGDNGIQVWRTDIGPDATRVIANRISSISAKSGGSGQNGNGINVFRASNVLINANIISDCAYSAVRGNAASNLQVVSNSCVRIGEVALYAEFEFEGAMISNNLVETAATGISVTNFNRGGRLATITGNLIRNLKRREFEPVDKRGVGISVEADGVVSNNVIENAPSCGLALGWGDYRRDIIAAQNIIRNAKIGVLVSSGSGLGPALITGNLITGSQDGAIRTAKLSVPHGPDLAKTAPTSGNITVSQNVTG